MGMNDTRGETRLKSKVAGLERPIPRSTSHCEIVVSSVSATHRGVVLFSSVDFGFPPYITARPTK